MRCGQMAAACGGWCHTLIGERARWAHTVGGARGTVRDAGAAVPGARRLCEVCVCACVNVDVNK